MSGIDEGIDGPAGFPVSAPATHSQDPTHIHLQHMAERDTWQTQERDAQAQAQPRFDGFQGRPHALSTGQTSAQQVSQGLMQYHAAQTNQIAAMQTVASGTPINTFPQPNANPANNARSIKRPRPVKSCSECRKRKLKCNRGMPCTQCNKSRRLCRYSGDGDGGFSDNSEEERERERPSKKVLLESATGGSIAEGEISGTPGGDHGTGGARRPSSVVHGPIREERIGLMRNGEFVSLEDLVTRLERLEQALGAESPARTDNSGSKMINAASPKTIRQLTIKSDALRTRFFGQNSPRVLVNLFPQAKALLNTRSGSLKELFIKLENLHKLLQDAHRTRIAPIPVFVESMISTAQRMKDLLPPPDVCKRLVQTYFETSEVVFRFLHIPSFWQKVEMYFNQQFNVEAHAYFLPQLLATVAIGSRFAAEGNGMTHQRGVGVHVPTACALVRAWLDSLRGKQLVDITTLQTELLLLHCQSLTSLARDHDTWTQLGYVVRMAMTMGLHRDPSEYDKMPVFTGELRRRLWYSILDMDLHVSMLCNLPALVRDGDYTTKPALNIDDTSLLEGMTELPTGKPIQEVTDCQMHCYAAKTLNARLRVSHVVHRIDNVRDYSEILDLGTRLEQYLDDINLVFLRHSDQGNRIWRHHAIIDMHVRRPLLALYRPFALGVSDAPDKITDVYLRSSMVILRYIDEMDPGKTATRETREMLRQMLRQDIVQACFSLCFFVKNALTSRTCSSSGPGIHHLNDEPVPFSPDITPHVSSEVVAPNRLVATVRASLDFLVDGVSALDIDDITSLSVVFWSVQRRDAKVQDVESGLELVQAMCLRNMNMHVTQTPVNQAIQFPTQLPTSMIPGIPGPAAMQMGMGLTEHVSHHGHHGMNTTVVPGGMTMGHTVLAGDEMGLDFGMRVQGGFPDEREFGGGLKEEMEEVLMFVDNWSSMVPPGGPGGLRSDE